MSEDGCDVVVTHVVEAFHTTSRAGATLDFVGAVGQSSNESASFYLSGFGFQPRGGPAVARVSWPPLTEAELEQEFASFADDALDWARHTAGAVPESWPDA